MAEDEARVTAGLHELGLPVPRVEGVTEFDGRPGIIFERVEGPSMLAQITRAPWSVSRMARQLADLHASVHAHRQPGLPGLRDALEKRTRNAPGLTSPEKERILVALSRLPDDEVVCHGDFHPDNILLSPSGPIIIDWADVHRGHPIADAAKTSLLLHVGEPPESTRGRWLINRLRRRFLRVYLKQYAGLRPLPADALASWRLPVAAARLADGIPQERDQLLAVVRADLTAMP